MKPFNVKNIWCQIWKHYLEQACDFFAFQNLFGCSRMFTIHRHEWTWLVLFGVCLSLYTSPVIGRGVFVGEQISNTAASVRSVYALDMDGDSDIDVLSASWDDDTIAWYENGGGEGFIKRVIANNADGANSVYALDMDGDHDVDVLSASYNDDTIAWYENNGSQVFAKQVIANNADGVRSIYALDVDNDGDEDVLSASWNDDTIAWYENNGVQGFIKRVVSNNADGARSVYALDVDGDGDHDVLSASWNDDTIAWYENNGVQGFTKRVIANNVDGALSVHAVDVDRDGDVDILSASYNDDTIAWYENNGNQGFTKRVLADNSNADSNSVTSLASVYAIDMDGDKDVDVLYASAETIGWYENDGNQNFIKRLITNNTGVAYSAYVSDVDGDGDMDVLSASGGNNSINLYKQHQTAQPILFDRGSAISSIEDGAYSVYALDVDGDSDVDVLSASWNDDTIAWYENNGSQVFTKRVITNTANGPGSVYALDMDGDSDVDVLSASYHDDTIAWYENNGVQGFTKRIITTAADGARSAYGLDMDGDGDGDVDVVTASSNDNTIAWYENGGGQNYTKWVITNSANSPSFVYAVDMNGDGDVDVLSASSSGSSNDASIAWYDNDGGQNFTKRVIADINAINSAYCVYAIDVDKDGDVDVLSASITTLAWYENDGSQRFTKRVIADDAKGARSVYALDMDSDGDVDVLSASYDDNTIAWHENDGSQNFIKRDITNDARGARSVYALDADGDGDVDVLSASATDDTVAWYTQNPLPLVAFSQSSAYVGAENVGTSTAVTLTRTGYTKENTFVVVNITGGSAATDVDYMNDFPKTIVFNSGETSKTIPLTITDDSVAHESSENITLSLASVFDAKLGGQTTATLNIIDNEIATAPFVTAPASLNFAESSSNNTVFGVSITDYDNDTQSVTLAVTNGTVSLNSTTGLSFSAGDGINDSSLVFSGSLASVNTALYNLSFTPVVGFRGSVSLNIQANDGYGGVDSRSLTISVTEVKTIFNSKNIISSNAYSGSVYWLDVDGDEDVDVLFASSYNGSLAWYENNGNQVFSQHIIAYPGVTSVYGADMDGDGDGDGDVDILAASSVYGFSGWYENNGSQVFSFHTVGYSYSPSSIYALDMDGDDDMDILTASCNGNAVNWYENDGEQHFTAYLVGNANGLCSVYALDVDSDGDMDLLSASYTENAIAWYENDGVQHFTKQVIDYHVNGVRSVYALDMDGDGDVDVLSASANDDTVAWYENDGGQGFYKHIIVNNADGVFHVYALDMDNDDDVDVLSASLNDKAIAWYENDGSQGFTKHIIANDMVGLVSVYAMDVDGDADMDVLSYNGSTLAWYAQKTATNSNSQVNLPTSPSFAEDSNSNIIAGVSVSDADNDKQSVTLTVTNGTVSLNGITGLGFSVGDGSNDSSLAFSGSLGSVNAALNNLTFSPAVDFAGTASLQIQADDGYGGVDSGVLMINVLAVNTVKFNPEAMISNTASGAYSVYALDVDRDGDMDVLSAANYGVSWYENIGIQGFIQHQLNGPSGTVSVYALDLDGDNDMDVLSASTSGYIGWYENEGGQFQYRQIGSASGARSIYALDMDGDNDMDVLSASANDSTIAWYRNNGSQGFTKHIIASNVAGAQSVYALDVDGDNDMDVLSASYNDDTIAWYENNGNQGFVKRIIANNTDGAYSVYALDIDRDDDIDILSASYNDDTIAWYENNGNQGFAKHIIANNADGAYSVYALDIDGDGDVDVLSASYNDDTIACYENDGSQMFHRQIIARDANGASAVYAADVDSDGDKDVLSASYNDNTIAWYAQNRSVNRNPRVILPSSPNFAEDSYTNTIAGISVSDADDNAQSIILTVTNGTVSLNSIRGLSFSNGDGSNDSNLSFNGNLVDVNAALNNLTLTPITDFSGMASLQVQTDDGNAGTDDNTLLVIVNDAPEISSINRVNSNPTNVASVDFMVVFSENVRGVDTTDFMKLGTASGAVSNVSGDGNTYTVTISSLSGDGSLGLGLSDDDSITNGSNVPLGGVGISGSGDGGFSNGEEYKVDTTAPRVRSIERRLPTTSPTNADTLTWRATFSEDVNNVGTADFSVTGTTATVTAVSEATAHTVYDVTVSGGNLAGLNGTVTLGFAGVQWIADTAGNPLVDTNPTGTNANTYVLDNSAPVITEGSNVTVNMSENGNPNPFSLTLHATDNLSATLTWSIQTQASRGTASVSGTGTSKAISYTPNQSVTGSDSFVVAVSDGNQSATITVNINIVAIDDAPVVANPIADVTVNRNSAPTALNISNVFQDAESDPIMVSVVTNSNPALVTPMLVGNRLTLTYIAEQSGVANITLRATANGKSVEHTFKVTVNAYTDTDIGAVITIINSLLLN